MKKYNSFSEAISHTESLVESLKKISQEKDHAIHITATSDPFILVLTNNTPFALVALEDGCMILSNLEDLKGPFTFIGMQSQIVKGKV